MDKIWFLFGMILYSDANFDFKKEFLEQKNNGILACIW